VRKILPVKIIWKDIKIKKNNSISDEKNSNILSEDDNDLSNIKLECKYCNKTYSRFDNIKKCELHYKLLFNKNAKRQTKIIKNKFII